MPEAVPCKILIGPFSPVIHQAGMLATSTLSNPLYLGEYLDHPAIKPFYMHPETMVALTHQDCLPELRAGTPVFGGSADYTLSGLLAQLPADWQPDLLIWWGFHYALPVDIADSPLPSLLIVADWHYYYETVREYVRAFDHVFCDRMLLQQLLAEGCSASYWPAYSFHPEMQLSPVESHRDYDIAFLGNTHPNVYAERNRWLRLLARLGDRYQLLIRSGVAHPAYGRLLGRSKIVFNHTLRGEMNLRAYEAAGCGALLMIEEDNLEVQDFLPADQACVLYNQANLLEKIEYYLANDALRLKIARNGQERIQAFSYQHQFEMLLRQLPDLLASISARPRRRPVAEYDARQDLLMQTKQLAYTNNPCLRARALSQLESQPATTIERDCRLLNALVVCRADYELLLVTGEAPYQPLTTLSWLVSALSRQLEKAADPVTLNNLAWLAFLNQDWPLLEQSVTALQALLAGPVVFDCEAMLLPLRFTPLQVRRQGLLFGLADQPAQLEAALLRMLRWSACYLQGNLALIQGSLPGGKLLAAAAAFAAACEQGPEFPEAWFELARCCQALGRPLEAISALEAGLEQGLYFSGAWLMLIRLLRATGHEQAARARHQEALILFQDPIHQPFRETLSEMVFDIKLES